MDVIFTGNVSKEGQGIVKAEGEREVGVGGAFSQTGMVI